MAAGESSRTVTRRVRFERQGRTKKLMTVDSGDSADQPRPLRISRLMALVIRYQQLLEAGKEVEIFIYPDQGHILRGESWQRFMEDIIDFFDLNILDAYGLG